MSDDLDRMLRESLRQRAEGTQHVSLAAGALRHAGRIKRRRRLATGVGVLAVVALAVPVGAQVIDKAEDHTASKPTKDDSSPSRPVEVAIAGLSQGSAPKIPYIDGRTFRVTDRDIELPTTAGRVTDAVEVASGALYWTLDPSTGQLDVASAGGAPSTAFTHASAPVVNPHEGAAAWGAASGVGKPYGDQLVLTETDTGQTQAAGAGNDEVLQVMGVSDSAVVYNARHGKKRFVGGVNVATGRSFSAWPEATYVTAVDASLRRMVGHTSDLTGDQRGCLKVTDTSTLSKGDWVTCVWRPVEFSADGSELLAIRPEADGLGQRELAVLDATNGDLQRVLSTDGAFGRATFEGSGSVLAVLGDGDRAAIVRCGIDSGQCELATEPTAVVPDDPESLVSPYQLTAN